MLYQCLLQEPNIENFDLFDLFHKIQILPQIGRLISMLYHFIPFSAFRNLEVGIF